MTIHLVTFSTPDMDRSADLCVSSGLARGCDEIETYHPNSVMRLASDSHRELMEQPRGFGYWSWKPLIILDGMSRFNEGHVIYSDAGIEFIENVNHIIDRMDQDIFLFGNQWEHAHWCKRDIVEEIMPNDRPWYVGRARKFPFTLPDVPWEFFDKQVQASVIFFRVNATTRAFVKEWLDWCLFEGGRLIDDSPSRTPNHPEFQENRHDQAILTTMAYRDGIKLHWWPGMYNDGAFVYERGDYPDEGYPVLFHHHRRRNSDWEAAA